MLRLFYLRFFLPGSTDQKHCVGATFLWAESGQDALDGATVAGLTPPAHPFIVEDISTWRPKGVRAAKVIPKRYIGRLWPPTEWRDISSVLNEAATQLTAKS